MSQNIDQALRARIDQFVAEMSELVREAALEAVREALGGQAPPVRRGPGRPRAAAAPRAASRPGKRIRRTSADLARLSDDIVAWVGANPGGRLGDIAKALGAETKDVRRPSFALLEEGKLRTEGQRGGTRYFPAGSGGGKSAPKKAGKKKARKAASK